MHVASKSKVFFTPFALFQIALGDSPVSPFWWDNIISKRPLNIEMKAVKKIS